MATVVEVGGLESSRDDEPDDAVEEGHASSSLSAPPSQGLLAVKHNATKEGFNQMPGT